MSAGAEQPKLAAMMFTDRVRYSALSQRERGIRFAPTKTEAVALPRRCGEWSQH